MFVRKPQLGLVALLILLRPHGGDESGALVFPHFLSKWKHLMGTPSGTSLGIFTVARRSRNERDRVDKQRAKLANCHRRSQTLASK
uniref:Secreted protein n=1 Tax=Anopheles atroparvus TaxID=41427 RepID=A0AAG5D646_ANOAO